MAVETTVVTGLEPRAFWAHFETLTRIPRPSRHEEPVIEHVRAWAAEHGFELHQDAGRNLVLARPGDAGTRERPGRRRSRATSTWSASASRRARTTRPRGGSRSSATATG